MKHFTLILLLGILIGCKGSESDDEESSLPTNEFSDSFLLSNFTLSDDFQYWEIRRGEFVDGEINDVRVLLQFDESASSALDETQLQILRDTRSMSGFAGFCQPAFCPVYAIAMNGYDVTIIDSMAELISLFGAIDTEAELWVRLSYAQDYAQSTRPTLYEETDDGYIVLLSWDTLCQLRGEDLVKVNRDGTIETLREVSRENYDSCV